MFESHICGPADFLVEIISPGDKSRDKLAFYAELGVRELLVVDRYPWSLELYRLGGNELVLAVLRLPPGTTRQDAQNRFLTVLMGARKK